MYIVIFITCANKKEGALIAKALLQKKLVACVNIVDKINSFFWWQGKIDSAKEVLLVAKSKKTKFRKIAQLVKEKHSYKVPEIIALPIVSGSRAYLEWIDGSLG
ncbi:MAG: divalent-cation tolerance protein CutA [Candidatus Omnitrophica bacterium]|nr:divalent-cation tolerance protein CutA [Candidatus Omnitrophota bacterium]MDD5653162.1 divalent-cation tolerance protein CutA [Candidatus Omnitrophota bacterium]